MRILSKRRVKRAVHYGINDPQARGALAAMADEFDAKAAVVEAEAAAEEAGRRCIELMGNGEPGPTFTASLNGKNDWLRRPHTCDGRLTSARIRRLQPEDERWRRIAFSQLIAAATS
jgi:hypothetical protein